MREHRREALTAKAEAAGHSREYADRIYDVAMEENLDPAIAFDVVLARLGVRELAESPPDNWAETQVEAPPEWIAPQPTRDDATLERHLRLTFRRLRSLIEQHGSPEAALHEFKQAPDVGVIDY